MAIVFGLLFGIAALTHTDPFPEAFRRSRSLWHGAAQRSWSAALSLALGASTVGASACQLREASACQSDIVSSTVVISFCAHRQGDSEVVDLLILWRGKPGWFQRSGGEGGGGSNAFGAGTNGRVSEYKRYGDVTIAYAADFDTNVATIGRSTVRLDHINTVVVDDVDGEPHVAATRWTEPRLPLVGDWNLALARRSNDLLRDLRCDIPMPGSTVPARGPQLPVITVCARLEKP